MSEDDFHIIVNDESRLAEIADAAIIAIANVLHPAVEHPVEVTERVTSLQALDRERREAEIEFYKQNPDHPMPSVFAPLAHRAVIIWPKEFK